MNKRTYDSNQKIMWNGEREYLFPNLYGHVEDTELFFINEKIYLTVKKEGCVTFLDEARNELCSTEVKPTTKNGMHDNAYCRCDDGRIRVWFPIVDYIDNYPDCDGEYDRWTVRYVGYDCVMLDIAKGTLTRYETKVKE